MTKASLVSSRNAAVLGLLLFLVFLPAIVTNNFYLHLVIMSLIWSILAASLNICMGYTGLVSLAQGSFFGVGAYGVALMVLKGGLNYWIALPLSLGIVVLLSIAIGVIALRTRGPYFVILSLCICMIITTVIHHWDSLTEGARGLTNIPPINPIDIPYIGKLTFDSMSSMYYLFLGFLFFTLIMTRLIIRSKIGRAFEAVRLNETLADSLGINVMAAKMFSFALAAFFAGLAGALYPPYISYLNPADTSFWISFHAILYLIVGGQGSLAGPVLGAVSMTVIPEILRFLAEFRLFFYALVLILTVIFFPRGLVSLVDVVSRKMKFISLRASGKKMLDGEGDVEG